MNKNVLANVAGNWHDFVIKDATVKQVALNVTDGDKINIVSSQAASEVSLKKSHSKFQAESCKFLINVIFVAKPHNFT